MKTVEQLFHASNYEQAKEYALEILEDAHSIPLIIEYLSRPQHLEECIDDGVKSGIAEALGKKGELAISQLITLYQEAKENLSAKFYAAYALSEYSVHQSGQISDEIRYILLDALSCPYEDIRITIDESGIPHHAENISAWIKFLYFEQIRGYDELSSQVGMAEYYFERATSEEIQTLEELFETANEEEIIGISRAVSYIRSKNMRPLIQQLLHKVKEDDIKESLHCSLLNRNNREC